MGGRQPRTVLIVGTPGPSHRGMLERARDKGLRVVLAKGNVTWERDLLDGWIDVTPFNFGAFDEVLDTILQYARAHPVEGVLTAFDAGGPTAAALASVLGLPGLSPEMARVAVDKVAMRAFFVREGLPCAVGREASSLERAVQVAEELRYPVVLKPVSGSGSIGVVRANTPDELRRAWGDAYSVADQRYTQPVVVIEEYLDGPEFSVEGIVQHGEIVFNSVTEKPEPMPGPYFAELEFLTPSAVPAPTQADMRELNASLIGRLGLRDGVVHTEMRLTASGPRLLEFGARLCGQQIPRLYELACGVDLIGAVIDVAMGDPVDLHPVWTQYAGYRCICPPRGGVFRGMAGLDQALAVPYIHSYEGLIRQGDRVGSLPADFQDNLGYLYATAPQPSLVRGALAAAERLLHVDIAA